MINAKLKWNIPPDKLKRMSKKALDSGVKDALEEVLKRSNQRVPLDKSTLLKSGNTDYDSKSQKGTVYYDTPYAKRLHEHPEYNFQRGREGKWLEKTANESDGVLYDCINNSLRRNFGG